MTHHRIGGLVSRTGPRGLVLPLLAAACLAATAPAARADDISALKDCVNAHPTDAFKALRSCIGTIAKPCLARIEEDHVRARQRCYELEFRAWEVQRHEAQRDRIQRLVRRDIDLESQGERPLNAVVPASAAFSAWTDWRAFECTARAAELGFNPEAPAVESRCRMNLTARRVLNIRDERAEEDQ